MIAVPALPLLAQSDPLVIPYPVPVLEGVTTALVLFIFVCVLNPRLVRNKTQFYAAFACALLVILLHSLNMMIGSVGFRVFAGAATGLLQVAAILLLFTSAGGLTVKELAGEFSKAYEVIRRGEEEKEVIVPITGEMPRPRQQPPSGSPASTEAPAGEKIDLPEAAGWPTKKPGAGGGAGGTGGTSIPLE